MEKEYMETEEYETGLDEECCVGDDEDQCSNYVGGVLGSIQDSLED